MRNFDELDVEKVEKQKTFSHRSHSPTTNIEKLQTAVHTKYLTPSAALVTLRQRGAPTSHSIVPIPNPVATARHPRVPTPHSAFPVPYSYCRLPYPVVPTPHSAVPTPHSAVPAPYSVVPVPYSECQLHILLFRHHIWFSDIISTRSTSKTCPKIFQCWAKCADFSLRSFTTLGPSARCVLLKELISPESRKTQRKTAK